MRFKNFSLATILCIVVVHSATAQTDPAILNWFINTTGATGSSIDPDMNALVSQILADVESVHYTDDSVYVHTSGVPSYNTGPFGVNPAYASDLDATYVIPRTPVAETGDNALLGLGAQGVFLNGVAVYNFADGLSYNNQGVWHQDANVFEFDGFDSSIGHPSPIFGGGGPGGGGPGGGGGGEPSEDEFVAGYYHHHQNPAVLRLELGDDGSSHSPIIGFAFDGFPIYGPYGFDDPTDSSTDIVLMESSYQLRDITERTTLADGTELAAALHGPTLEEVALGGYQEDFAFVENSGHLDVHNGRFAITPDYPEGSYAYFVTLAEDGTSTFPHMLGPTFYGELVSQENVVIPADAVQYVVPESNSAAMLCLGMMFLGVLRRRKI